MPGNQYDILTSRPSDNLPEYDRVLAAEKIKLLLAPLITRARKILKDEENSDANPSIDTLNNIKISGRYYKYIDDYYDIATIKNLLNYLATVKNKNHLNTLEKLEALNSWLLSVQTSFTPTDTTTWPTPASRKYIELSNFAAAKQEGALEKLTNLYWNQNPPAAESTKPMPRLQKLVEAWRAFHIARLMIVRTFNLHKKENDPWGEGEDLTIDFHNEHIIETTFVAGSLSYIGIFLLVAYNYAKNKSHLTSLERARMQFEMWDALVWFSINVVRLNGAGALKLDTAKDGNMDIAMSLEVHAGLLLFGYLFDLINQLIYDLRQVQVMNNEIEKLKREKTALNASPQTANKTHRNAIYDLAINQAITKRDAFVKRSVISNVFYALGLSSGAICNIVGAGKAGFVFGATPIGIVLIFLSSFINQSKNWYVAVQDWQEVKQRCGKQHDALNELNTILTALINDDKFTVLEDAINTINNTLIKAGLCPLNKDQFSANEIRNYRITQYIALADEMHAANNKVQLYSYWFSMILTSMVCLAFASSLIGLVVFLGGSLIYCGLKFTGLVPIEAPSSSGSTSKMCLQYARTDAPAPTKASVSSALNTDSKFDQNSDPIVTGPQERQAPVYSST